MNHVTDICRFPNQLKLAINPLMPLRHPAFGIHTPPIFPEAFHQWPPRFRFPVITQRPQLPTDLAFYKDDRNAGCLMPTSGINDEPKPTHSYIGLIAMAILDSEDKKLVLSDIYQWILDNYAYFRARGPGWRNSIRHNLSLNDCFVKSGRSANGKGHYWAIHPANRDDFVRGDYRRRRAQRRVRRAMGLAVPDEDDDSPPCTPPLVPPSQQPLPLRAPPPQPPSITAFATATRWNLFRQIPPRSVHRSRKRRTFDVDSLLADSSDESRDDDHEATTATDVHVVVVAEPEPALIRPASGAGDKRVELAFPPFVAGCVTQRYRLPFSLWPSLPGDVKRGIVTGICSDDKL